MEQIGYYIQPMAFYLMAMLTLKMYHRLKRLTDSAQSHPQEFNPEKVKVHIASFNFTIPDYFGVRYDEFNWLKQPNDNADLWDKIHISYLNELTDKEVKAGLLKKLIIWVNVCFPMLELVFPSIILLAYILHIFIGPYWMMCSIMDIINALSIIIAVLLLITAWIPVSAYRKMLSIHEFSEPERKRVRLTFFLIHISQFIRLWGLFRKVELMIRWIFIDEVTGSKQSKGLAG